MSANDYVSSNLATVCLDEAFPEMTVGEVSDSIWPYLRRGGGHKWYADRRNPTVGFVSRDEAMILYNTALLFQGRPCLEIGCWRGWSTAHIARASGSLDVIDPVLEDPDFLADVRASLARAGVVDRVILDAGASPEAIDRLASAAPKRWSFVFIDGDHDGAAPRRDAEAAARHAADTAILMFHDLLSPSVAAGLDYLRDQGWKTRVYLTMQVMGVAWRGDVEPVAHTPDLAQHWTLPPHLDGYDVSGVSGRVHMQCNHETALQRLLAKHLELLQRLAAAEQRPTAVEALPSMGSDELDRLHSRLVEMAEQLARLSATREIDLARAISASDSLAAQTGEMTRLREVEAGWLAQVARLQSSAQQSAAAADEAVKARAAVDDAAAALVRAHAERDAALAVIDRLQAKQAQLVEQLTFRPAEPTAVPAPTVERFLPPIGAPEPQGLALAQLIARPRVLVGLARRGTLSTEAARQRAIEIARQHGIDGEPAHSLAEWLARPRVALGLLRRAMRSDTARLLVLGKLDDAFRRASPVGHPVRAEADRLDAEMTDLHRRHDQTLAVLVDLHRRHDQTLAVLAELEAAKRVDEEALLELRIELATVRAG